MQEVEAPSGSGRALWLRAHEILSGGPESLAALPDVERVKKMPSHERRDILEDLRTDLYAIAAIVGDAGVRRARDRVQSFPPYGLVRSMFTDFKVLLANPGPITESSIDSFHALGKAYIDTTVWHLDAELKAMRSSKRAWIVDHAGRMLALFRVDASPDMRARFRDVFSFVYGGLQFGTSTCVQLVEVMRRLLVAYPDMSSVDRAIVIKRSIRPAYNLAALNVEHVLPAYTALQPPSDPDDEAGSARPAGWMDPEKFAVEEASGKPHKISLRDDALSGVEKLHASTTFSTRGCPARISPLGHTTPIAQLWNWCIALSLQTKLV